LDKVNLIIDDAQVSAKPGTTLLKAARGAGIYIPTLCSHELLPSSFGSCRLCVVQVEGGGLPSSCVTPVSEGAVVQTNTPLLQEIRRHLLKAVLAAIPDPRLRTDELRKLAEYIGISEEDIPPYVSRYLPVDTDEPLFIRDHNLCIMCGRCVNVCRDVRGVGVLDPIVRDGRLVIGSIGSATLREAGCRFCGACVEICPTGALSDRDDDLPDHAARIVPCTYTCPANIDVPRYIHLVAQGRFTDAAAVIREKVPFPGVLGYVCYHPCEDKCRRGELNEPIAICSLKRVAAESDRRAWSRDKQAEATGKNVAVVGSGPAGLTAAFYLAKQGHSVTVFEVLPEPGGMMRVGIPEYRLPREILDDEIAGIQRAGVEIKTNTRVESLDHLFKSGYDAVFLALGAHQGIKLGVEGEDAPEVLDCINFLQDVNLGKAVKLADKVVVIGGGNAAMDAARTAWRLGAKEVTVIYRRSRNEMPASAEEVDAALEEGANILFLATPSRIERLDGSLKVECIRMKLGEPDDSGRPRPVPIEGSEFAVECGNIIAAIGQTPEIPNSFNLQTGSGNTLEVDPDTLSTGRQGVFSGGDVVLGPASVIEAIAQGRKAASSIDRYLSGSGDIDEKLIEVEEPDPYLGRIDGFADLARAQMPRLPVDQRKLQSMDTVELGFAEEEAIQEAERCLRCDLRTRILPTIPPTTKVPAGREEK